MSSVKKEVVYLFIFLVLVGFSCAVVEVPFNNITLQTGDTKEMTVFIKNEDSAPVLFEVVIFCSDCLLTNYYADSYLKLSMFNSSIFDSHESKVGLLEINALKITSEPRHFDILFYENGQIVKNQSINIMIVKNKKQLTANNFYVDLFLKMTNKLLLFVIICFCSYFGLKLFIRTGGPTISKVSFVLIWLLSSIILTLAFMFIFKV